MKMAAALFRCRFCSSSKLFHNFSARFSTKTYYVLLPEVPSDTAETNPLLQVEGQPRFNEIKPVHILTACSKLALEYEIEIDKHFESLKDPNFPKTFETVVQPIKKLNMPIKFAANVARSKYLTNAKEDCVKNYMRVIPQIDKARDEIFVNDTLFSAVQEVKADKANLNEYEKRFVDYYLLASRHSGIEVSGASKEKYIFNTVRLNESLSHFSNRLSIAVNMFFQTIKDFNSIVNFPIELLREMSFNKHNPHEGPWRMVLYKEVYDPFMEHCSHRMLRWNIWRAQRRVACHDYEPDNVSNHMVIEDIRQYRRYTANILGYESHAHLTMDTTMAGSVDTVINFIESLKSKFYPKLVEDLDALHEYAHSKGIKGDLELWDIPYWRRLHKESLFNMSENEDVKPYFPYKKVLESLFNWCRLLFGVELKDITSSVQTWPGRDVTCYSVIDIQSGEEIGSIYVDPYARDNKYFGCWSNEIRDRNDVLGVKPISYIHMGITLAYESTKPVLLTVKEAHDVFAQFGQSLQQLMCELPFSDISGVVDMEVDSKDTCAKVMGKLFYNPTVLRSVTSHYRTGEALPEYAISTITSMSKYLSSYDKMYDLYISAFDMEMNLGTEYWRDGMKKLWPEYMPITLQKDDEHPCSLSEIFSGSFHSKYYSNIWSEMLAADIAGTFEQAGFDNPEKLAVVGRRFRETYLSLGGALSGNEIFRRFQGRDPSVEQFLKFYDVTH